MASETRGLNFSPILHLNPYFVHGSRKDSGEGEPLLFDNVINTQIPCGGLLSPRFLSVGDIAIASVRPSRYLLLNHWTKFNQIWFVSRSHE